MTDEQIAQLMADPRVKQAILEAVKGGAGQVTGTEVANNTLAVRVKHEVEYPKETFGDWALDVGKTTLKVAVVGCTAYAAIWGIAKLLGPAVDMSEGGETIDV